jgi:hypothetical protein
MQVYFGKSIFVYRHCKGDSDLSNDFPQVNQLLKSKNIMAKLDAITHCDLLHCIQRAEALIQTLGEAVSEANTNPHHLIMIEVIEEYLLRARKSLGDH